MKKELFREIEIPQGVEVTIDGQEIKVKGPEGEISREFDVGKLDFEKRDNKVFLGHKKATKREKKMMNTLASHVKNMVQGVQEKYEYQLKICFSHFPFTVDINGQEVLIKNFLGEKISRKTKIPEGAEVEIAGEIIKVKSADKELAGQVAANFERLTKIRNKDRRVFQDGIFMISKAGREI